MEMFRECGWPAFVVLALGVVAALLALTAIAVAIARPRAGLILGVVALAVSCSVPGTGVGGTLMGKKKVDEVVDSGAVSPDVVERIRKVGYQEAAQCTNLGLGVGSLPLLLAVVAIGLGFLRRNARPPEHPTRALE